MHHSVRVKMGEDVTKKLYRRSFSEGDSTNISSQIMEEIIKKTSSDSSLGDDGSSTLLKNEDEGFIKEFFIQKTSVQSQRPVESSVIDSNDLNLIDAPLLDMGGLHDSSVEHVEGKLEEVQFDNGEQVNHILGDSGYISTETNSLSELEPSLSVVEEAVKEQEIDMKGRKTCVQNSCTQIIPDQKMEKTQKKVTKRRIYARMNLRKRYERRKKLKMKGKKRFKKLEHLGTMISPKNGEPLDVKQIQMAIKMISEEDQKRVLEYVCIKFHLQKIGWKDLVNDFATIFNRLIEIVIFPIWELPDLDYRREWDRLCSFGSRQRLHHLNLVKVSYIKLAKCGFFYEPKDGQEPHVKCFACSISWPVTKLEAEPSCNEKLESVFHLRGCNLRENGNKPMHLSCLENNRRPYTLPSKNKLPFTNECGLVIRCKDFCALNSFYADQATMLKTFPSLKEKYESYKPSSGLENPFRLILQMLDGDSTRGMVRLLRHLNFEEGGQNPIVLSNFEIINFICELMKEKIVLERKCSCGTISINKEQIIVHECKTSRRPMNGVGYMYFQECINETLQMMTQTCEVCGDQIKYDLQGPPPCLFVSLSFLKVESSAEIPKVVHIYGRKYRRWAVYLHGDNHFTCEFPNSNGGSLLYDDQNVMEGDNYSGHLVSLEYSMRRPGKPCMVSFCIMEED